MRSPRGLLLSCIPWWLCRQRDYPANIALQDLLLSWGPFQQLLLFAFRRKHGGILAQALQQPLPSATSFDDLEYYVDPNVSGMSWQRSRHVLNTCCLCHGGWWRCWQAGPPLRRTMNRLARHRSPLSPAAATGAPLPASRPEDHSSNFIPATRSML